MPFRFSGDSGRVAPGRKRRCIGPLIAVAAMLGASSSAFSDNVVADDDFMYYGGPVRSRDSWPTSSGWGIAFRQTPLPYFAWSLGYLNNGHFPGHHRDGVAGEVWVPFTFADEHLTASIGGGPYYYFDTQKANNANGFADVHGWAWVLSADLRVHLWSHATEPGWFLDFRFDWSAPTKDIETHSWFTGIGYRMYSDWTRGATTQKTIPGFAQNEILGYFGKTVVNSPSPPTARAEAGEYRRQLGFDFTRVSVAFVNEGNAALIRRNGVIYEGWLEPSFWDGNASVGAGWGGYTALDKYRSSPGRHVSYVVSATLSARPLNLIPGLRSTPVAQRLALRFTWHRIVTDYNRDTDILLFGLGYRF
jgi:hypothetical protein